MTTTEPPSTHSGTERDSRTQCAQCRTANGGNLAPRRIERPVRGEPRQECSTQAGNVQTAAEKTEYFAHSNGLQRLAGGTQQPERYVGGWSPLTRNTLRILTSAGRIWVQFIPKLRQRHAALLRKDQQRLSPFCIQLLRCCRQPQQFAALCRADGFSLCLCGQGLEPALLGRCKAAVRLRQQICVCLLGALEVCDLGSHHAKFSRRQPLDCTQQIGKSDLDRYFNDAHRTFLHAGWCSSNPRRMMIQQRGINTAAAHRL